MLYFSKSLGEMGVCRPKSELKYSFETSQIISPAEIIECGKEIRQRISDVLGKINDLSVEQNVSLSEDYLKELNALLDWLKCPVDEELFRRSNDFAEKEERPQFTWEVLQTLYGTHSYTKVNQAFEAFKTNPTDQALRNLVNILQETCEDLENNIKRFGGDTEARVKAVTQSLHLTTEDPSSKVDVACNWHGEKFGVQEEAMLNQVIGYLRSRFKEINLEILELGCGDLRVAEVLNQLSRKADQYGKAHEFYVENFKGVEYSKKSAEAARKRKLRLLRERGLESKFDPSDILLADFFVEEGIFEAGQFHLVVSLMRTIFHGLTFKKLSQFLKAADRSLKPMGILLVDSVNIATTFPDETKEKSFLGDLINLYGQFAKRYKKKYQQFMPEGIDLERSIKLEIEDNTAGNKITSEEGFYPREIITPEYLKYAIDKLKLDFKIEVSECGHVLMDSEETPMSEELVNLGRKWIRDNLLENDYRLEIGQRLKDGNIDSTILRITGSDVEKILDYIAYQMVLSYPGIHIQLKKKEVKKAA